MTELLIEPVPANGSYENRLNNSNHNHKIAGIFGGAGIIQNESGIKRIQNSFLQYGLDILMFDNFQHRFKVTAFTSPIENFKEKRKKKGLNQS